MKNYILCIAFLAVHTSYSQTHYTQLDSLKNKKTIVLNAVVVQQNPFKTPVYATRSDIKLLDLPQGIQTVDKSIIQQQQAIRLSDVVKNINGAYVGSARGGAQESFWSRGYDLSSNNIFKNGFRVNSGSMPEVASLERVEFLKGNSALLFGNVVPGGVVNLVTKVPQFQLGGEISLQSGSYSFYKPSLDIYNGFTKNIAYRLVANYENSKSFRDIVQRERLYINPSLLFKIDTKTEFILQADYLTDDWTPDFGTAMVGKEILELPRNTYMGATWSNGTTKQTTVTGLLKHSINENWKLNFNSSFQDYRRQWIGTERIQPDSNGFWNRPLGKAKNTERIYANQFGILGKFYTYNIKHQVLAGVDWENSFTQSYTYTFTPTTYGSGNVFDFSNFNQGSGMIPDAKNTRLVETTTNRFGIYAQDLISFQHYFKLLLGLRWSWQQADIFDYDLTANPTLKKQEPIRIDKAFSPKIGLVYQPTIHLSIFASYSNSFTPNTGLSIDSNGNTSPLDPSIINQYEVGIKKNLLKNTLAFNITAYQIDNSNLSQVSEININYRELTGKTRSQGVELDITGNPTPNLSINAGYSYNYMTYLDTPNTDGSFVEGERLVRTPANTANASIFYTLPQYIKGLRIGLTAFYTGERLAGWNNLKDANGNQKTNRMYKIGDFTTVDFSVGYQFKKLSIMGKVGNLFDVVDYNVHENYSVNPITPRNFYVTLNYKL